MPESKQHSGVLVYKRLLKYVSLYKWIFLSAILGMIITALADAGFVSMLKPIMDEGLVSKNPLMVKWLPLMLVGVFLLRGIGVFVDTYCMTWVARKTIYDMRQELFETVIHLPVRFYDHNSSASLVSKLVYDVEQVAAASTSVIRVMVKDSLTVTALLCWMAYLNFKLTLVLFILLPVVALIVKMASNLFRKNSHEIQRSVKGIANTAKEAFQGHKIVKTYGGEDFECQRFETANDDNRRQTMKKAVISAINLSVILIIMGGAVAMIIKMAIDPSKPGLLSAGGFVSYLGAIVMMMSPVKRLAKVNETLQAGIAGADSVFTTIDELIEIQSGSQSLARATGKVSFENVSFNYTGTEALKVLDKISMTIMPGQSIALVGASGSGKSTIVSLLLRFYESWTGSIKLDDKSIKDIRLKELRSNFSIVTQDAILFDDTLRNNITYASTEPVDEERLLQVCEAAHVTEFLARLPEGINTLIGERGTRLSGGQRQRIAIARAFYKNAPILILDEATSALDTHSERLVQQATQALKQGRTTIVIAHRLSTIENADCIYVMDQGRIVESGTNEQLINKKGYYARLWEAQQLSNTATIDTDDKITREFSNQ